MPMGRFGPCDDVGCRADPSQPASPAARRPTRGRGGLRLAAVSVRRRQGIERVTERDRSEPASRGRAGLVRLQVVTGRLYRPVHDVLAAAGPSALLPARSRENVGA